MARPSNPNSKRQLAFAYLDEIKHIKRIDAIKMLREQFNIGIPYAQSLHAAHRTINKQSGKMSVVYVVRDVREGKPVAPYIKELNTFTPPENSASDVDGAKLLYVDALRLKIKIIDTLSL